MTAGVLAFLNELSTVDEFQDDDEVRDALIRFVDMLRAVRDIDSRAALVTDVDFHHLNLSASNPVAKLRDVPEFRDYLLYLLALRNVSPYPGVPWRSEVASQYSVGGSECKAFGLAHEHDQLCVSFALHEDWLGPWVAVTHQWLSENDEGEEVWSARHAGHQDNVLTHEAFLRSRLGELVASGKDMWTHRERLFPNLRFLPRVQSQLVGLDQGWVNPVRERLDEISRSVGEWRVSKSALPSWKSLVSPESESRKGLCYFDDGDVSRLFDTHARFTPGVGRIHFRVDPTDWSCTIAHVGRKLGA